MMKQIFRYLLMGLSIYVGVAVIITIGLGLSEMILYAPLKITIIVLSSIIILSSILLGKSLDL